MLSKSTRWVGALLLLLFLALGACECDEGYLNPTLGELQAVPDPVPFGEVPVSTVKELTVKLENLGSATVYLHDLEVTENPADFSIRIPEEVVFPYAIAPSGQVSFTARYHPQSYPEDDTGVVHITSTDKGAPEYDLQCLGTAVEPILLVEPVPVDFGSTRVLGTSPATLTITHTGSIADPVEIQNIQIADDAGGDFTPQEVADLPLVLNPEEETRVRLAYTPQAIDDHDEGQLLIESDAESQERMEVPLLGSSHAPHIEVSTTALDFQTVSQGANPTLSFDILSTGNDPLHILDMRLTQTSDPKFSWQPASVPDPIAPLGQVTIAVTYIADDRGDDNGTLWIDHDDPLEQPVRITLHGRTPEPDVDVRPDRIDISISNLAHEQSAPIRIYNLGDENLSVTGMEFSSDPGNDGFFTIESQPGFPASVPPGTLQNGPYEEVVVKYSHPDDNATVNDTCWLTFSTDDRDEAEVVVTVVGNYTP